MLKFEFVVTGTELTDSQKERITSEFPALVSKALATQAVNGAADDGARFWCMCKVNGCSVFAREQQEQAVDPHEPALPGDRSSRTFAGVAAGDRAEVLTFELV